MLPGSSTRQFAHGPPPGAVAHVTEPPDTVKTSPSPPRPKLDKVFAPLAYKMSPVVTDDSPVPPFVTGSAPVM